MAFYWKIVISSLYSAVYLMHKNKTTGRRRAVIWLNGTKFCALLHMSSSQKHMCPVPLLSIMHTWSTINKFICSWDVHVLRTTSYAINEKHFISHLNRIYKITINLQITRSCIQSVPVLLSELPMFKTSIS